MSQISRLRDAEISNGNLINADDIDVELNQLVAESNGQDTRLTSLESSAMTINGAKTFTSAPKMDQIDERTAAAGVTIDSVLHKDGTIRVPGSADYTPEADGDFGYDSTDHVYKVMTNSVPRHLLTHLPVSAKSGSYTAVVTDLGALFVCNGTFTLSLTEAATLGNGWFCEIKNSGTGVITIAPNGSETLDGLTTLTVYAGESFLLFCDGSNFSTVGRQKGLIPLLSQAAGNNTSIDFIGFTTSDFDEYELHILGLVPATDDTYPMLRISQDTGATWKSGASDYNWMRTYNGVAAFDVADNQIYLIGTTSNGIGNAAGENVSLIVNIIRPSASGLYKTINFKGGGLAPSGNALDVNGTGFYQGNTNAIDGIRILMSSGNISSGTFTMYGVRK